MNTLFGQIQIFLQELQASELILGILTLVLLISLVYYFWRTMALEDKVEDLQKDYAPRRKRVYQAFMEAFAEEKKLSTEATADEILSVYQPVFNDISLWGSDTVVKAAVGLKNQIKSDPSPEKVRPYTLWLVYMMRKDLGFNNRGVKHKVLNQLLG